MTAFAIFFIGLLFFTGGYAFAKITTKPVLDSKEKKELNNLKDLRGELTSAAYDHIITEPFAVIVLDIITII